MRDLNGNGTIDNQSELFGSASQSGFAVLSTLDQNSDGVINSSDQGFASLSLWQDLNRNGITDQGELRSLITAGISAITLNPTIPTLTTAAGNTITGQSTVTFSNGQIRKIFDVVLEGNQSDTKYLGDSTVSTAALAVGSNLKGYGNVKNLDIAMTGDATLLAQVTAFNTLAPTTSWPALRGAVDDFCGAAGNDNCNKISNQKSVA